MSATADAVWSIPSWVPLLVSACSLLVAGITATITIRNSSRTRDFTSLVSLRKEVKDASDAVYKASISKGEDAEQQYVYDASHYFDSLELVAFTLNSQLIRTSASEFMTDWLIGELSDIDQSEGLKAAFAELTNHPDAYTEIAKFKRRHEARFSQQK